MERSDAAYYANYRLKIPSNQFGEVDFRYIQRYIKYKTGVEVDYDKIRADFRLRSSRIETSHMVVTMMHNFINNIMSDFNLFILFDGQNDETKKVIKIY